jgi:GGDEF domain-containing protein
MTPENIFYIYRTEPHAAGHIEYVLTAKFLLEGDHFEVLEDHGNHDFHKLTPAEAAKKIHRFTNSMYYQVVNLKDILQGLHPELLKELETKQEMDRDLQTAVGSGGSSPPSADYEYERVGGEGPRILSISDGQVFLDGHLLSEEEHKLIQDNVSGGKAFLRRRLKKSIFNEGYAPQPDAMSRHLEEDTAVPGVGNLRAYNNFLNTGTPGIHMMLNMHDTKALNAAHGHEVGNRAIRAVGTSILDTAKNLIGRDARVFRLGGDRFAVHVPSTEGAALMARGIRQRLESIPPVLGTHGLTVSIGAGPSKEHAEWAMHDAHAEKNRRGYPPGKAKTHVAVRIPGGLMGPIPTE